jgi:DNA-binding response OmpR family regulator/DNA-binding CsgD family transcriptional regulator
MTPPAERHADVVLIVDDVPDNLAVLHDTLDESGYTVLVATDGPSALERAARARPDVILLDAMMPGMDGFEVARRLRAEASTAAIPIIFMTGLTETEHVVAAFAAGGTDYVTKPIRAREVIARITAHSLAARERQQARNALDAFGHATLMVRLQDGRIVWQTSLARQMLEQHFDGDARQAPAGVLAWLRDETAALGALDEGPVPGSPSRTVEAGRSGRRLRFTLHEAVGDGQWLLVLREADNTAALEAMVLAFGLTPREAEVLYWIARGKTNRDIGEILGSSPATVKKHLEHVYEKLGVETRSAAAALALSRVAQLAR